MSNQALDLLIECELLKSNGAVVDLERVPDNELSLRYTHFVNARQNGIFQEIETHPKDTRLNAQLSTWSAQFSKESTLSSLLIYNRVVLNDPLVSANSSISYEKLRAGLDFYSWLHPLIRAGLVAIYPINYYDKPSEEIPFLASEDAFRSSISPAIHDFAHSNVILKSAIAGKNDEMYILAEDAFVSRRTALSVAFKNDTLYSGVGLFKHTTLDKITRTGDKARIRQIWDKDGTLPEDKFKHWAYQATNQAIIARLKAICNQASLAQELGNTYITESEFESTLLSLSNTTGASTISPCVKFLNLNNSFINIESPTTIIRLRDKYSVGFERFNSSLLAVSEELHGIEENKFDQKCSALFHKEIMPQVDEVRDAIGQIGTGFLKGTLLSLSGIGLAIGTGSAMALVPSLLASASTVMSETLPAVRQLQSYKKRPGYIWHRLVKS
ncbi:hypothetical protein [Pseudomonas sp. LAMO17WK12:I8]|nr:hypothetical protein [Pseudomonas sp. LAMO17WK12:I8]SNT23057.1 hypothetical protein SAMN05660216_03152 [Pseudomonas sp. LAMO17WK12:I8]SNY27786.1 hypothetical protein SAMN05660344_03078 [Pseudomonas sp. LAMO17WK12:I11]SNY27874.1 hypothetical protein SAMN05660893_03080 [Pseudomonas sp. LAMO17WK12:I12]SNY28231.1 hypothetical protein SAMN05660700_03153 [Pseudomonas sp. LAMO17WK12:I7]